MKVNVCGVAFDKLSLDEAIGKVFDLIKNERSGYVVTPNTEILARAKDGQFLGVLSGADLVLCDGVGVSALSFVRGRYLPRVTGVDLAKKLLFEAARLKIPVFLYGAKDGVAQKARQNLEREYEGIQIVGVCNGYQREEVAFELIRKSGAKIVFVCTSSPKQEYFAQKAARDEHLAVYLALGGVLDLFSGEKKRAPKIFQKLGLEWAYRFCAEPFRIKRFVKTLAGSYRRTKNSPNRP